MPNLFPTNSLTTTIDNETPTNETVKFGRSPQFDFEKGEFILTPSGKVSECEDVDAWLEWCQKALLTIRYRYLAYSRNYGQEFEDLIARHLTLAGNESEIKRMVTECLMADPRTSSVSDFSFSWTGEKCCFSCKVTSARDENETISGSVVIN